MLELPEVITLSKQVNNALSGKTITQVFNATKDVLITSGLINNRVPLNLTSNQSGNHP